jgi:5-methyltetrahydrofolate--homocysteine methyltransferase
MAQLQALADAIISGNRVKATEITGELLKQGTPAKQILDEGLIPGMAVVGEKFKNCEFYVPEVLVAARAMSASMDKLRPELLAAKVEPVGRVAIGTVRGDLHDIGKNLVAMMLEGAGFEIIDLGVDCSPESFVDAVKSKSANLIALSALLTTTMPAMQDTVEALEAAGLRAKAKVIIGGAPVTQKFADQIGADGYAPDAASGVDIAKKVLGI